MEYSISEVSRKMNVSISTLRYYDNIGLFPNLKKDKSGNRLFDKDSIETLRVIQYMKKAGMKLEEIKEYINWCKEGDSTILKRLELFKKQKENVLKQMKQLEETLNLINFKKWYYTQALNDGTEINVKNIDLDKMPKNVQEEFKKCHLELK